MKKSMKLISLVIAFAMIIGTVAVAFSFSASAAETTVFRTFNSYDRHYGYGQSPKTVTYTSGGYVTLSDTGRFARQHQLAFPFHRDADVTTAINAIKTANDDYNGLLSIIVDLMECQGSNTTEPQLNCGCEIHLIVSFKYKDPDMYHPTINPDSWVSGSMEAQSWTSVGQPKEYKLAADEFIDILDGIDEGYYTDLRFTSVILQAQNYANNPFTEGEYKGQAGLGFETVQMSPIYVTGADVPAVGEDLGEDFIFEPNAEDPDGPGYFIIGDYKYPQVVEEKKQDGKYGNGSDIDRSAGEFIGKFTPGDCNNDGAVNAKDTLLLRKYLAKWNVEINLDAADCNGDGAVNAKDTLLLRKYLAKWDVELG